MQINNIASTFSEFSDSRLVAIYDTVCALTEEKSFYLGLAANLSARSIIDLGCGTGLLTYELAKQGHYMIGVEPSVAMLKVARHRFKDERVQWIEGGAEKLGDFKADLAIMTGHVAQFFLDDSSWLAALKAICVALKPGGYIAFESRNPNVSPFTDWPSQISHRKVIDPVAGPVEWWLENLDFRNGRARYEIHYLFLRTGQKIVSAGELIFRSQAELTKSLSGTGFAVESVYGDWDRHAASEKSSELIFVASRA